MCNCVCIDELTDVCLYIHVCMPIYEKLYRCKTLKPVKLVGLLQSSQQGQDFPHLGNTQDCFLLQVTSKRGLIYLKMTCGITLPWRPAPGKIFQPHVPKNSPSPCTPSPCPVCCVAGSVSSTHSAYTHTSRPEGSQLAMVTSSITLSSLLPPPFIHLLSYSLTDLLLLQPNSPV